MSFEKFTFKGESFRWAQDSDVAKLRTLVNASYKELSDMGLNYTATYQDEQVTRERICKGKAFVLEREGQLIHLNQ
jgi:hypothetical protein